MGKPVSLPGRTRGTYQVLRIALEMVLRHSRWESDKIGARTSPNRFGRRSGETNLARHDGLAGMSAGGTASSPTSTHCELTCSALLALVPDQLVALGRRVAFSTSSCRLATFATSSGWSS